MKGCALFLLTPLLGLSLFILGVFLPVILEGFNSIRPFITGIAAGCIALSIIKMFKTRKIQTGKENEKRKPLYRWKYRISGKERLKEHDCKDCGASFDHTNFFIEGGEQLIFCGYCKSLFRIEPE